MPEKVLRLTIESMPQFEKSITIIPNIWESNRPNQLSQTHVCYFINNCKVVHPQMEASNALLS